MEGGGGGGGDRVMRSHMKMASPQLITCRPLGENWSERLAESGQ